MDLGEIGFGGVNWVGLAQDRDKRKALVNAVMNLRVPYNSGNVSSGYITCASRVVLGYIFVVNYVG
jgi:hypothetical protein